MIHSNNWIFQKKISNDKIIINNKIILKSLVSPSFKKDFLNFNLNEKKVIKIIKNEVKNNSKISTLTLKNQVLNQLKF
jgi:hypothetical protein